jgi:hypothetical protein
MMECTLLKCTKIRLFAGSRLSSKEVDFLIENHSPYETTETPPPSSAAAGVFL